MKTFLMLKEQGGGCDYTIGCGINYEILRAASMEDAKRKALDLPDNWKDVCKDPDDCDELISDSLLRYVGDHDSSCESITLYEIVDSFDLMGLAKEKITEIETYSEYLKLKEKEEEERKQYEKLKKKFDK